MLEYFNLTINIFQLSSGFNGIFYLPQSLWGKFGLFSFLLPFLDLLRWCLGIEFKGFVCLFVCLFVLWGGGNGQRTFGLMLISASHWDFASGWPAKSRAWTDVPWSVTYPIRHWGHDTGIQFKNKFNCQTFPDTLRLNCFDFPFSMAPFTFSYLQMSDYILPSSTSFHHRSENLSGEGLWSISFLHLSRVPGIQINMARKTIWIEPNGISYFP